MLVATTTMVTTDRDANTIRQSTAGIEEEKIAAEIEL